MKVKYIPHPRLYTDYYCQHGDGGYFSGLPQQKGYGIGGLVGSLIRNAVPLLKSAGKQILKRSMPMVKKLGRQALMSGVKGVTDVITNKRSAREAFKESGQSVGNKLAEIVADEINGERHVRARRPNRKRVARVRGVRRTNVRSQKKRKAIDILS